MSSCDRASSVSDVVCFNGITVDVRDVVHERRKGGDGVVADKVELSNEFLSSLYHIWMSCQPLKIISAV